LPDEFPPALDFPPQERLLLLRRDGHDVAAVVADARDKIRVARRNASAAKATIAVERKTK